MAYALAAAVIAGLRSFRVAVIASLIIGVAQAVLTYNFLAIPGITDLLLFIAVFVAVVFAKREGEDSGVFAFSPRTRPIPERLRSIWWARNIDKGGILLLGVIAVVLPLIKSEPSSQQLFTAVLGFAICASSLTVLTGWLGQLSLGQMAFAGLAALFAARLVTDGVPFWVAIVATVAASGLLALGVGIGSLRVRGLYLAVVTFVLALTAQQYFYYLPFFSGESPDGANVPFVPGRLWFLNFPGQETYYYVVLVVLALVVVILSRLRDSGAGRTIKALRDNEVAATAYGVRPVRLKLQTFALSGGLAGLGGALLAGAYAQHRLHSGLLLGQRLAEPGRHGGDRGHGLGVRGDHRRHRRDRHPRSRPQQRAARSAQLKPGSPRRVVVLPPGSQPADLWAARRDLVLGGQAVGGAARHGAPSGSGSRPKPSRNRSRRCRVRCSRSTTSASTSGASSRSTRCPSTSRAARSLA